MASNSSAIPISTTSTVSTVSTEITAKKTKKPVPTIIFIYLENDVEKRTGFMTPVAKEIPAFSEIIQNSGKEFRYAHELSTSAMTAYFKTIVSRISPKPPIDYSNLTAQEWNQIFWLAFRLNDLAFFDNTSFFPDITSLEIDKVILQMPEPAKLHYCGAYLGSCFYFDCNCDRLRISQLKEDANEWLESQNWLDRQKYLATPRSGNFKPGKTMGYIYDQNETMKTDWLKRNADALQNNTIFNWYDLDLSTKIHLVHLVFDVPKCSCNYDFYEMWNKFCTFIPSVAKFLWDNMKRDQFLLYAKTSDPQKDGSAGRKKSFNELKTYVEFVGNKK